MSKPKRWWNWVIVPSFLLIVASCSSKQNNVSTSTTDSSSSAHPSPSPVTTLEPPRPVPVTKLEIIKPSHTTTIAQQGASDLKLQQTSTGIRVDLPIDDLFGVGKSDILPGAKSTLSKLNQLLKDDRSAPVSIAVYSDDKAKAEENQTLSKKRAEAVKKYLVQTFGMDSKRVQTKGFSTVPFMASGSMPEGAGTSESGQTNRRVEVVIDKKPGK